MTRDELLVLASFADRCERLERELEALRDEFLGWWLAQFTMGERASRQGVGRAEGSSGAISRAIAAGGSHVARNEGGMEQVNERGPPR